jgi:transcriptional regulator with XRE-family HTH domain
MNKNQRFIRAVDYLIGKKHVKDAKTLCEITGLSESTISNIRSEKKAVSLKSVCKLSDAFPGMFNPEYFQGVSEYLLIEDAKQEAVSPSTDEPTANIIELYASLIQDIEKIRQQVKQELAEVQALKHEYITARDDFRKAVAALHPSIKYTNPSEPTLMAAEETKK